MEYIANNTKEELEDKIDNQQALIDELVDVLKVVLNRTKTSVEEPYDSFDKRTFKIINKAIAKVERGEADNG